MTNMIVIRNGLVLQRADREASHSDILVRDGTIILIGPPGMEVPGDAATLDAGNRLVHPVLVCCYTHGNCTFGKGQFCCDRM